MLYRPLVIVFAGVLVVEDSNLESYESYYNINHIIIIILIHIWYDITHIVWMTKLNTWLSKAFRLTTWCREDPTPFAKNKSGTHNELISFSSTEKYDFCMTESSCNWTQSNIALPVVVLSVKADKFNLWSFQNCLKKTSMSYRISSWFSFDIEPT